MIDVAAAKKQAGANLADGEKSEDLGGPVTDQCGNLTPEWRDVLVRFSHPLDVCDDAHKQDRWADYASVVARWRVITGSQRWMAKEIS
jgi:hypothetical protein